MSTIAEPVVTTYRRKDVGEQVAEAIAKTGAEEGDGLVISQEGDEVRVRTVGPLEAGRVYRGREAIAAMKALLRLRP